MNTKTTLVLLVTLAALFAIYSFVQRQPEETTEAKPTNTFGPSPTKAAADLFDPPLGDVVKVTCQRKGDKEWDFEKRTDGDLEATGDWYLTAPEEMKCVSWEVSRFGQQLGKLQYEVVYKPGEPGAVSAEQAGLDPPSATIRLTDAKGNTAGVEIGRPASANETYVRLTGDKRIFVVERDLSKLVKEHYLDYREKQLWMFDPKDVKSVEVVDRSDAATPVTYKFTRNGAQWTMESPVAARATSKVDDMLTAMSRQRVVEWHDNDKADLGMYGLSSPAWTVSVTVEEKIAPEAKEDAQPGEKDGEKKEEKKPAEPKTKVSTYELDISDMSPLGQNGQAYVRIGGTNAVGSIMKSAADKCKPVMAEWRDMRVTASNVASATRIELSVPEGSATLVNDGGKWSFDAGGGPAESAAVTELLKAISSLTAVAVVDGGDPASMGLGTPYAEFTLEIPGADHHERIAIGGFTDPNTKRLRFAQRNELTSYFKVKASDLTTMLRGPNVYRDRTVVEVLPSRFESILITAPNAVTGTSQTVILERDGVKWKLTSPVAAPVRNEQVDNLVETLGGLRAENVAGSEDEASSFGLKNPSVGVMLTYKPPKEYRVEKSTEDGKPSEPVEVQPPSVTVEIFFSDHDGKVYAKRSDRSAIYEVKRDLLTHLLAEYHDDRVVDFNEKKVKKFTIRDGAITHGFERTEDHWVYSAEPDMPLDKKKVENLLIQVRDLRSSRYAVYESADLAKFGLNAPQHEITLTMDDGTEHRILISSQQSTVPTEAGYFASVEGTGAVFLLKPDVVARVKVNLDELD